MTPKKMFLFIGLTLISAHAYPSSLGRFFAGMSKTTASTVRTGTYSTRYNMLKDLTSCKKAVTPCVYPLKQILDSTFTKITHLQIYNMVLSVFSKKPEILNRLIIAHSLPKTQIPKSIIKHTPILTQPSLLSKFTSYFRKAPEPTLAQMVYFLAYNNGKISPCQYPLKVVLERLKKQIPDPELYKQCIISLCTTDKPTLQELIDTQLKLQQRSLEKQMYKGLKHSKRWLRRYNAATKDLAESQHSIETKLLTTPTKLLTVNTQPTVAFKRVQKALNKEINHAQQLVQYTIPTTTIPVATETKLLATTPTVSAIITSSKNWTRPYGNSASVSPSESIMNPTPTANKPHAAYHQISTAPKIERNTVYPCIEHHASSKDWTRPYGNSASVSPSESIINLAPTANKSHAAYHQMSTAPKIKDIATSNNAAPQELTCTTSQNTSLRATSNHAITPSAQLCNNGSESIHPSIIEIIPAPRAIPSNNAAIKQFDYEIFLPDNHATTPALTNNNLCLPDTAKTLPMQQAYNLEIDSAQKLLKFAKPYPIETKLLATPTKLLTENTQPTVTFAQVQKALNQEITHAQQLLQYAVPATTIPVATETKLSNFSLHSSTNYKLPAAAAIGGMGAYAWYHNNKPESVTPPTTIVPTNWLTWGAIGATGAIIYKILYGTQKEEKPTEPEIIEINDTTKSTLQDDIEEIDLMLLNPIMIQDDTENDIHDDMNETPIEINKSMIQVNTDQSTSQPQECPNNELDTNHTSTSRPAKKRTMFSAALFNLGVTGAIIYKMLFGSHKKELTPKHEIVKTNSKQ